MAKKTKICFDQTDGVDDDIEIEIGKRPILQFWKALKEGYIKKSKDDTRYAPFQYQYDFLTSKKTNCHIIGANKSGKSEACHIKTALTMMGFNKLIPAPNDGYVIGVDWPTVRDTIVPRIFELIPPADIANWSASKKRLTLTNGSTCIFKSADSGRLKFQAALLDWVQIDEEIRADVYKEVKMRGKGSKDGRERRLYVWGAALPMAGYNTYLYKDIFQKRGSLNYDVFSAKMDDNFSLSEDQKDEWKEGCSEAEYKVRILGEFVTIAGTGVFNNEKLQEIKELHGVAPKHKGRLILPLGGAVSFDDTKSGNWKVWEMPKQGHIYSIGVDSSTGESDDYSCIQILDISNCEQVAEYYGKVDEDTLALETVKSGKWYSDPTVIIEVTGGIGRAVQNQVMKLGYYNLYRRETGYDQFGCAISDKLGWETKGGRGDGGTKPLLLLDGKRYVHNLGIIHDIETIEEFQNYLRNDDGSSGARAGCHDDRVMAYLLALRQINEGKCCNVILPQSSFLRNTEIKSREDAEAWLYD